MVREKKLILAGIEYVQNNGSGIYGSPSYNEYSNKNKKKRYPRKLFDKVTLPVIVNLQFDFKLWVRNLFDTFLTRFIILF